MSALRLQHFLPRLLIARAYAYRAIVQKQGRALRLLQRPVAAAHVGLKWLRPTVELSIYMGLR